MAIQETRHKAPTVAPPPPPGAPAKGQTTVGVAPPRPPRRDPVAAHPPAPSALPQRQIASGPAPRQRVGVVASDSGAHKAFGPKDLQQAVKGGEHLSAFKAFGAKDLKRALQQDNPRDRFGDPSISRPTAVAPKAMTGTLLPAVRPADLPLAPEQQQQVQARLKELGSAIGKGQKDVAKAQLRDLVALWRAPLEAKKTPGSLKLAFTLSDGQAFLKDVKQQMLDKTSIFSRPGLRRAVDGWADTLLQDAFNELASGVLDKALARDRQVAPTRIEVKGRVYERASDSPLGGGNFGEVWLFTNPADENDRVVLKVPGKEGNRGDLEVTVHEPLREGQNSVQGMGMGISPNMAQLVGVLRTPESVQLVYRFEPGGSLDSALVNIDLNPSPELAQGKLALMLDMVGGVRRLGEGQAVVHSDLAMRNMLIDAQGRAVIADFGMAATLPEGTAPGQGEVRLPSKQFPVRWAAPEVLDERLVSPKSDVFSLGVTFLEMAKGPHMGPPFKNLTTNKEVAEAKRHGWDAAAQVGDIPAHLWPGVDVAQLKDLIVRMLDADPSRRPSLEEVARLPLFAHVKQSHRDAVLDVLAPPPQPHPQPNSVQPSSGPVGDSPFYANSQL